LKFFISSLWWKIFNFQGASFKQAVHSRKIKFKRKPVRATKLPRIKRARITYCLHALSPVERKSVLKPKNAHVLVELSVEAEQLVRWPASSWAFK
jgi:hypothetical protein